MKHLASGAWLLLILLFIASCGDPGTTTTQPQGGPSTDAGPQPGPPETGKSHPYSETANQIDPNKHELLDDIAPDAPNPFNQGFIRQRGITRMQIDRYGNSENELSENSPAASLQVTARRVYEFDSEGKLMVYDVEQFADLQTLTKTTIANEYDFHRNLSKQTIREKLGEKETLREISFTYDEQSRLLDREDSLGINVHLRYNEEMQHVYRTEVTPGGVVSVTVSGQPGDFPDETALTMQDEILSLGSEYVPYDRLPGLVRDITFKEMEERKIVRQVNMGPNGVIDGVTEHKYNTYNNLLEESYLWDDETALFRSQTSVTYNPGNDVTKVIRRRARHEGGIKSTILKISYGPEGRLEKMILSSRQDNGPEVIEAIEFVSYKKVSAQPQPGVAVPGGAVQ
jgi:hypothetical protein